MSGLLAGLLWGTVFVLVEAVQFVYFGGLFQHVDSFLFGFLVFAIVSIGFVGRSALKAPQQLALAFRSPGNLLALNLFATLAWASYLTAVEWIEPAVVYTVSAGAMPISAYLASRLGLSDGPVKISRPEMFGMVLLLAGIIFLAVITIGGHSGFVQNGGAKATAGIALAVADGVFFTLMLVYSRKLDQSGIGPDVVFGLRFPLYVAVAGSLSLSAGNVTGGLSAASLAAVVGLGLVLTVPHLYALQRAVAHISTPAINALTTVGPFVVFVLQRLEGRVTFSGATLVGLFIYFAGSLLSLAGVWQTRRNS